MDALGLRDELREIARRVANAGYYVAVPDLYYRLGDGITFIMGGAGFEPA